MADLDAFFAKKAEKKKKKGKGGGAVMDMGALASNLERAAEVAEEEAREREKEEAEKAAKAETFQGMRKAEDSDWHDYVEATEPMPSLHLKDMDLEAEAAVEEEEKREEEDQLQPANQTRKTWATGGGGGGGEEENSEAEEEELPIPAAPEPEPAKPQKSSYVPPAQRRAAMGMGPTTTVAPDLGNEELFPSLADADTKAKEQEAELKKMEYNRSVKAGSGPLKGQTTLVAGGPAAPPPDPNANPWTEVRNSKAGPQAPPADGKYRPGMFKATGVTPKPAPTPTPPAGSPLPSRPASNAWGPPKPPANTPPPDPPATNANTNSAPAKTNSYVPPHLRGK